MGKEVDEVIEPLAISLRSTLHVLSTNSLVSNVKHDSYALRDFMKLLWATNHRILEILGTHRPQPGYFNEQSKLQDWFFYFVLERLRHSNLSLASMRGEEKKVFISIFEAIGSNDSRLIYRIKWPQTLGPHQDFSRGQLELSKAVVLTIIFYYKNQNPKKWDEIFGDGASFLGKLCDHGRRWTDRPWIRIRPTPPGTFPQSAALVPWSDPLTPEVSTALDFSRFDFKNINKNLRQVLIIDESVKDESMTPTSSNFETFNPKIWVWIFSLARTPDRFESDQIPKYYHLHPDLIDRFARLTLRDILGTPVFENVLCEVPYTQVLEKLQRLSQFLWALNSRLLHNLGCMAQDEADLKEQSSIQRLLFQLGIPSKENELAGHPGMNRDPNNDSRDKMNPIYTTRFKELLAECLTVKDRAIYKMNKFGPARIPRLYISEEQITMTKLVVEILETYYRTQNEDKWNFLFEDPNQFVGFLQDIRTRIQNKRSIYFELNILPNIRYLHLFPWADPLSGSAATLWKTHRLKRVFQTQYTFELTKMVFPLTPSGLH